MKFNERELIQIASTLTSTIEGRMDHQKPQGSEWSDWYSPSAFKERWFKLKSNLLFYYRISNDFDKKIDFSQPAGVYVLETSTIQYENSRRVPFAFSISFRDESDKKHIFACRSEEDVNRWVAALKCASYEYLRTQLKILQKKISMKTGNELRVFHPLGSARDLVWSKEKKRFQCHLDSCSQSSHNENQSSDVNLIDL